MPRLPLHALTLALVLLGCPSSEDLTTTATATTQRPQELGSDDETAPPATPVARETALLSLVLSPDGKASFAAARRKPIAFPVSAAALRARTPGTGWALEVHHPQLAQPLRLPVSLGTPGKSSAPAMDPWQGGGTVLRAPWFGAETRYELLAVGEDGETRLAQVEVRE